MNLLDQMRIIVSEAEQEFGEARWHDEKNLIAIKLIKNLRKLPFPIEPEPEIIRPLII